MRVSKKDLIPLSEAELAALIASGRPVHATYPGGDLIVGPNTRWCLPIIAKMRGVSVSSELEAEMSN